MSCCILWLALPARTAEPEPSSLPPVSWTDVAAAVDRHPAIAARRHAERAVASERAVAEEAPNPELEAAVGYGQARDGSASRVEWELALTVPLGWTATRGARIAAAEARLAESRVGTNALRLEVLAELRQLFWKVVHARQRVTMLQAFARRMEAVGRTVRLRLDSGDARPVERTLLEIELEKLAGELETARMEHRGYRRKLGVWLGERGQEGFRIEADLSALPPPVTRAEALANARAHNPAMAITAARVRSLAAELESQEAALAPDFAIRAFAAHELDRQAYGAALVVELPLWNWNSGAIEGARARLSEARQQVVARRLEVEQGLEGAWAACDGATSLAVRYRDKILPKAEQAAATTERIYKLGDARLLELLDARRTVLVTRSRYLDVLARAQLACSRLRSVMGEDEA